MKNSTKIISTFFILLLLSCQNENKNAKVEIDIDIEMEVLCGTIEQLVPKYPLDFPITHRYSEKEEVNRFRVDSITKEREKLIDSLGLEIWLLDKLIVPSEDYLKLFTKVNPDFSSMSFKGLKEVQIKQSMSGCSKIHHIVKKELFEQLEFNTLGFVQFSRVILNDKKDEAKFMFSLNGNNCIGNSTELISARKKNGKWQVEKK